MEEINRYVFT